ncbi:MAG: leucine-rich repeat protein [Clostridiales Family XIII bacterium]|jgi:hypothetical protein|nr:leucine-rich repeat protein [Clostridiales Family XIII bacterium]
MKSIESIEKRTLRLLVCALGLLFVFAFAKDGLPFAFAEEITTEGGVLTYSTDDEGNATILSCLTSAEDDDLIAAFDEICTNSGISIIAIGSQAFRDCVNLTKIELPDSVVSIGNSAFESCDGLTNFDIPDSVTSIGEYAFSACSGLTNIVISDSVMDIKSWTFHGCTGLTNVTIPGSVTSIGEYAFNYCIGLTSVIISDSVKSIGEYAFYNCIGLTSITIPESMISIGVSAFSGCTGLTSVDIPDGLTSIGDSAFYGCTGLISVTIPDSVTSIGGSAFSSCTALTKIELPDSLTSIGNGVFSGCTGLTSVTIPAGVTSIGNNAFSSCTALTEIELPDSLTSIGNNAFSGCRGLINVTIPAGVTSIGSSAFSSCTALTEIELSNSLTSIGSNMFSYCAALTEIELPNSLTNIGNNAFSSCTALTEIELPNSLTSIGQTAFSGCIKLTSVTIPDSVTSIGSNAFSSCTTLTFISVAEGNPVYSSEDGILFDKDKTQIIRYPCKHIQTSYTVKDTVTSIGIGAFQGCIDLTSIIIPTGVTSIGVSAFSGCRSLTVIDIPDNVTSIGGSAFNDCRSLTSIDIPDSVTSIGNNAFSSCTALTEIELPNSLTSIGNNAFSSCTALTEIELPNGLLSIGSNAFSSCTALTEIELPDGLLSIGSYAFRSCTVLTEIELPDSLTDIGFHAFYNTRIEKIIVPASVATVGIEGAFGLMGYLNEIVFKHGMESFPTGILTDSFSNNPDIHVPMSLASGADTAGLIPYYDFTIHGVKDTYIIKWAEENGIKYNAVDGEIRKTDIEHAWLNVPYQYIIETGTYENVGLNFNVVGGTLPDGLELLPDGQFHGAPLETGTFTFVVEVRYPVFDYLLDIQSIVLTVEEPVGYPGDIELFESNDYTITDFVGESTATVDGVPVGYVLTAVRDDVNEWVFRIADKDINDDGQIDESDSNFPYFTDFWLDGEKLTSASAISGGDYGASEGSTVVTVYAKTFQNLDNGNHTIAAEFMIPTQEGDPPVQKVAAQKFTLELSDPEPVPEDKPDPEPDPDLNTDPDPDTEPGSDPKPDPEQEPNTDPDPDPEPGSDPDPNTDPATAPDQNTPLPGGTSGGGYTTAAPAQSGTEPNSPAVLTAPSDTSAADETPAAPVIVTEVPITIAEDTNTAGGDTNPAGTVGAAAIDGLPRDENGLFYFVLDGSDAPLEARIDVPLADFADMYFDGELWTPGEDYAVREGSTIIVIAAEKLAGLAYGMHEISARFTEDRTVAFTFDLRGFAPANDAETGPAAPAENAANAAFAAGSGLPAAPFVIAAVAIILLIAAALILRGRQLK